MWALFSSNPLVPTLLTLIRNKHEEGISMPEISGFWVTTPIGVALYLSALFVWFRRRRADDDAPQESRIQGKVTVTELPTLDEDQWSTMMVLQQESDWVRIGHVQIQAYIGNHDPDTGNLRYDLLHLRLKPDRVLDCRTDLSALTVYRSDLDQFVPDAPPFEPAKILGLSCQMFPGREASAILVNCTEKTRFTVADQVKRTEKGTWCATLRISSGGKELGVFGVTFDWSPKNGLLSPGVTLEGHSDLDGSVLPHNGGELLDPVLSYEGIESGGDYALSKGVHNIQAMRIKNTQLSVENDANNVRARIEYVHAGGDRFTVREACWLEKGLDSTKVFLPGGETRQLVISLVARNGSVVVSEDMHTTLRELKLGDWRARVTITADNAKPLRGEAWFTVVRDSGPVYASPAFRELSS